jgi:hypothetical protein
MKTAFPNQTFNRERLPDTPEDSQPILAIVSLKIVDTPRPEATSMQVLVIDDRATMHRAHGDYDRSQSRVLWRIIVDGERPRRA